MINWQCSIQFVSPTANKFSTVFEVENWLNNPDVTLTPASFYNAYNTPYWSNYGVGALRMTKMVYQGVIRRISHTDEKVRVELEDLTEKQTHKNLPTQYLGTGENVLDKYKNKPIPMVYGNVDTSPLVLSDYDTVSGDGYIIADSKDINSIQGGEFDSTNKLLIHRNDAYNNVLLSSENYVRFGYQS